MRKLGIVAIVLAGLWSGYWVLGARATGTALGAWIDARAAEGWVAEYGDIATTGYPARFETAITGLELADPATGVAWSAPAFRILMDSHRPNRITAVWPESQTVASPFERVTITSAEMTAQVAFDPGTSLTLNTSEAALRDLHMVSTAGWQAALAQGTLTTTQAAAENHHDIRFQATGLQPADALRGTLDPAGILPPTIETLRLDATLGFDAPWDRFAIERARPGITAVDLRELRARWGQMDLRASGNLTVDADGVPEGRITVRAENWRQMLDMARAAGLIPEALVPTAARALELLAGLSGAPETLDAPLSFQRGYVSFGPIPLGPAPRLVLR